MKSQDSFEKLVEDYTPMIHHIINKLHIYKDFEHYFQLGLIALWETTKKYDEKQGRFASLAYQKIRGKLLDQLRNETKYYQHNQFSNSLIQFEHVDENSDIPLETDIILSYCNGLREKPLKWVWATFIENKSMTEIAKDEGVSIRAVRKWKEHALHHMREKIKNQ